jgi:flagellar motor switch protein FliN/FliY
MALISELPASVAAAAAARALEQLLGHDVILAIGDPVLATPTPELLDAELTRSVALPFGNGVVGEVTLVVTHQFATTMEAATEDSSLVSAALPALQAAAAAIEPVIHLPAVAEYAGEIETDILATSPAGEFVIVPVLEDDQRVASLVVRMVADERGEPSMPTEPPITGETGVVETGVVETGVVETGVVETGVVETAPALPEPTRDIARHDFQMLGEGGDPGIGKARPLPLLNDVRMEVTAELGRRRMKVRDIVALAPGSIVELDRAAGSPVDVLVNGTLIAHGEVVVIDEEFGIRVSEIVVGES